MESNCIFLQGDSNPTHKLVKTLQNGNTPVPDLSIAQRIWKYKFHYLIVIPAISLIFALKFYPFITAVLLAFKDFKAVYGLFSSPWAGWDQFADLFGSSEFRRVLANTLVIKFSYMLASGALALVVALALSHIRSARMQRVYSTLFVLPYFIPSVVFAYIVLLVLSPADSPDRLVMAEPGLFRPVLVVAEVVRTCGIPILLALAAISARQAAWTRQDADTIAPDYAQTRVLPAVRAIAAFMLLQLSTMLSTDFDLVYSLLNPFVLETGETLNAYVFRQGFVMLNFGLAGTAWFVSFLLQLAFTILAFLLVKSLFVRDLFIGSEPSGDIRAGKRGASVAGHGLTIVFLLPVLYTVYLLFVGLFVRESESGASLGEILDAGLFARYLYVTLGAVIVHMLMTLTLAYPLTVKRLPGRNAYKFVLLLVIVSGGSYITEYMFMKSLGLEDTIYPYAFYGFFNLVSVFVLKEIFNGKYGDLKEKAEAEGRGELHAFFHLYVPKVWKPLLALGALHYALIWNSFYTSLIYTSSEEKYSPVLLFRTLAAGSGPSGIQPGDPLVLQLGVMVSLPGIVLLLAFRKWLTSEVFLSQIRKL